MEFATACILCKGVLGALTANHVCIRWKAVCRMGDLSLVPFSFVARFGGTGIWAWEVNEVLDPSFHYGYHVFRGCGLYSFMQINVCARLHRVG
jgi:hypothetical protein